MYTGSPSGLSSGFDNFCTLRMHGISGFFVFFLFLGRCYLLAMYDRVLSLLFLIGYDEEFELEFVCIYSSI